MTQITRRDVFQAIADPTRRGILSLLIAGSMTPNALAEHFHTSRQAVSKHVSILAECGLVSQQVSGREIFYHLNMDKIKEVDDWLEPFRQLWRDRFSQLDNLLHHLNNEANDQHT